MANLKNYRLKKITLPLSIFLIILPFVQGYSIDYDDDYTHSYGDGDDGIVWGGGRLDVGAEGISFWDKKVICYDWCGGAFDNCYGKTQADFDACWGKSSTLLSNCQQGKCSFGDPEDEHDIDTGSSGAKWTCTTTTRLYDNCEDSNYYWQDKSVPYYVISPRQYKCVGGSSGGKYYDGGNYKGSSWVILKGDISCGSAKGCSENKDDGNADFGSRGTSTPAIPCSYTDGNGDCDSNGDCMPGSHCSEAGFTDRCCPSGKEWDGSTCASTCSEGWLNEYKCNSDTRQRRWQDKWCNKEWRNYRNCNDDDSTGSWSTSCPSDSKVEKERTVVNGFCSSKECKKTTTVEKQTVSQNGDANFCRDRKTYSCSLCGKEKFDCDFDTECASSAPDCVDFDGGACFPGRECGCCASKDKWDTQKNECYNCTDGDGDTYYPDARCPGSQDCNDKNKDIKPGATEICNDVDDDCDGSVDEGGVCDCDITSAVWDKTSATEGDKVGLTIQGNSKKCNGKTATFGMWEADLLTTDDPAKKNASSAKFSSGKATSEWTAEWQNDCNGACNPPEYYYIAKVGSEDSLKSSNQLTTEKKCTDEDDDDYYKESGCGTSVDCNDKVSTIHPGATETCNDKDDDCDDSADEGFNKQTDPNNCGSCGTVCSVGNGQGKCASGKCGVKSCSSPFKDCDSAYSNGCEIDSSSDINNCGSCNTKCGSDEVCKKSTCIDKCGDGNCDSGEACPEDCLRIKRFVNPPSAVDEGKEVTIQVEVSNVGTVKLSTFIETAIVPKAWEGSIIPLGSVGTSSIVVPHPGCCKDNEYFKTLVVELDQEETETLSFTFNAPSQASKDQCGTKSAWGSPFLLASGMYKACGGGYFNYTKRTITVNEDPCDKDGKCETGENEGNCKSDCGCNNNGKCEEDRGEDLDNCFKDCEVKCERPDGSSRTCDCDSDPDCAKYGDFYCKQVSGWDACKKITFEDQCTNKDEFMCEAGDVYKCASNGKYYEKKLIEICGTGGKFCDDTEVDNVKKCSQYSSDLNIWIDNAPIGTTVNKKIGDKGQIKIYVNKAGSANLNYNTNIISSTCSKGSKSLSKGLNTCDFSIKDDSAFGTTVLSIDKSESFVKIVKEASFLVITDEDKLLQRFPKEASSVRSVLKQAYADAEDSGIVYDLSMYDIGESNPFPNFVSYRETFLRSYETDNDYALAVSSFVKNRCNGTCTNTVILGDDFVIPTYRRDITQFHGFAWWKSKEVTNLYTDQHLIEKSYKPFSEIEDLFTKKQSVKIIIDPDLKSKLHKKVENLTNEIEKKTKSKVKFIDPNDVACNSFSLLEKSTLIIIGGEENNAIRCHPFIPNAESYLSIENNVWDTKHYSIILDPTESRYDNLLALINIVTNGPEPDWDSHNYIVACLWSGKFSGSVPTAKEISCNMIPLVEIAPDIRDSYKCWRANKDEDTPEAVGISFVCKITHLATVYDIGTWGAAIFTAGTAGVAGEVFDGGIATLKVFLKNGMPEILGAVGKKAVGDARDTLTAAPKLLVGFGRMVWKSPKNIKKTIEGVIQVLKRGPDNTRAFFKLTDGKNADDLHDILKNAKDFDKASRGLQTLLKFGVKLEDIPYKEGNLLFAKRFGEVLELFGDLPTGALNKIEFKALAKQAARFEIDPKTITFRIPGKLEEPLDAVPSLNLIAHEVAHAETLKKITNKLDLLDDQEARQLAKVIDDGTIQNDIRGISEFVADLSAFNKVETYNLDDFIRGAKINNFDLETTSGVSNLFIEMKDKRKYSHRVINHYLAYIHALGQETNNVKLVQSVENFITDTSEIPLKAKTPLLNLAKKIREHKNIVDESPEAIKKGMIEIKDLSRQIDKEFI